jgi:exosome complex component RRP41
MPFLTVATVSGLSKMGGQGEDGVSVLVMESRVGTEGGRVESMLATGVDGCKSIRAKMEDVVRRHGSRVLAGED